MVDAVVCKAWHVTKPVSSSRPGKESTPPISVDDIVLQEVTVTPPSGSQVRVKVHFGGVTPLNVLNVQKCEGIPLLTTKKGSWGFGLWRRPSPDNKVADSTASDVSCVGGMEGIGVVDATGGDVSDLLPGDLVIFYGDLLESKRKSPRFWSEYVLVDRDSVVKVNEDSDENSEGGRRAHSCDSFPIEERDAAAMPYHGWTAYIALFDKLLVKNNDSIFIDCGHTPSGVGYVAAQLAVYYGLEVVVRVLRTSPTDGPGGRLPFYLESLEATGAKVVTSTNDSAWDGLRAEYDHYLVAPSSSITDSMLDTIDTFLHHRLRPGGSACFTMMSDGLSARMATLDRLFRSKFLSLSFVCFHGLLHHPQTRQLLRYVGEQVLQLYRQGAFRFRSTDTDAFIEDVPFENLPSRLLPLLNGTEVNVIRVVKVLSSVDDDHDGGNAAIRTEPVDPFTNPNEDEKESAACSVAANKEFLDPKGDGEG